MKNAVILLLLTFTTSMTLANDDFPAQRDHQWHQWRGPMANGAAPHGNPPIRWAEGFNVKWKVRIPGEGNATPVVWKDRIFILTAVETEKKIDRPKPLEPTPARLLAARKDPPDHYYKFVVMALDRKTGRVLWEKVANELVPKEGHHRDHGYASASPITDGKYVYASFGSHGIYCYDFAGDLKWERDLGQMRTRMEWGEGASPALHNGRLFVNWDHEDQSFLTALDAKTGQPLWRVDRDEQTNWSTPLVTEHEGVEQVIVSATNKVRSYDTTSGKLLWECGGQRRNVVPTPVVHDGKVICMSSFRGLDAAAYAICLDARGDITDTDKIAWRHDRNTPYVPSPLLYGDLLYFIKANSSVMTCLDAKNGKPLSEQTRLPKLKNIYSSPVGAKGRVYFTDRNGTTLVAKNQAKLEVLSINKLDDHIDASAAIVGNQMFLRGKKHLYCIEEPAGEPIVLFDGKGKNLFLGKDGKKINWKIDHGELVSTPKDVKSNHIVSKLHFRDADIHVEFMLPPKNMGSGSGNSGVYIHGNYEMQIINSYGKKQPDNTDMGAVYKFSKPLVNAARQPGVWQVYDIRYRAPRRDKQGRITRKGSITAWLNGKKVQDNTPLGEPRSAYHPFRYKTTPYTRAIWEKLKKSSVGPVFLQDHDNPVRFRNVWVRPLDDLAFIYDQK
ncbi:MAG: DUF1080 domain-containing protein [Pirellulales bacterium]|nr:DUF1080 domain-containing protein [Pirellulales bacterium]